MSSTVLIVDDSSVSRMIIKSQIKNLQPDWHIIEAADGHDAILSIQEQKPDFVTMDVNMPGITGLAAIEQIRTFNQQVKIVLLTANIQNSSIEKAESLGVCFLAKPISADVIKAAVNFFLS